jgi:hypothetical protein
VCFYVFGKRVGDWGFACIIYFLAPHKIIGSVPRRPSREGYRDSEICTDDVN